MKDFQTNKYRLILPYAALKWRGSVPKIYLPIFWIKEKNSFRSSSLLLLCHSAEGGKTDGWVTVVAR